MSALLGACNGGGSDAVSTPAAPNTALGGTAATGSPIANASVTLVCGDGTTKTATTDANGAFTFSLGTVATCKAPFALAVTGQIGDTVDSLVSMQPTDPAAGTSVTVNITPITNAIAATVAATGNPLDLVNDFANQKANITTAKVGASEQGFRDALGDVLASVGASGNLINTAFAANGTSPFDKLLDVVKVEVKKESGEISISTVKGSMDDDLGNQAAPPAAASVLVLQQGQLPSASNKAVLPAGTASDLVTVAVLEPVRAALQACFALQVADRGTIASPKGACATLPILASYKNQGRTASQEFDGLLADAATVGATFATPEIVRELTASKVLAKFSYTSAGSAGSIVTVAALTGTAWTLAGNQRDFELIVSGYAVRRDAVNTPTTLASRLETGIAVIVRNQPAVFAQDATITAVKVFGPGLPGFVDFAAAPGAGLALTKLPGCDFWSMNGAACRSLVAMKILKAVDQTEQSFAALPATVKTLTAGQVATDAQVLAITPNSLYKFVLTTTGGTITYWERLRSRPYTTPELKKVTFPVFSQATVDLVTTGSATFYNGGIKPTISWTLPSGAAPAINAKFFHGTFTDQANLKFADLTATIPCSANADCVGSDYKTPVSSLDAANTLIVQFQVFARNRFDTQIVTLVAR